MPLVMRRTSIPHDWLDHRAVVRLAFIAVTWIGIFLTRATVHSWLHRDERENEMVSNTLSNFFVPYGILLESLERMAYTTLKMRATNEVSS
jgi:hypothetical protein